MKNQNWPILGKLSQKDFLGRYWQKRPLLMKKALVPFPDLITPEELAGMACDPAVESRLIIEKGGKTPWELRRGPLKHSTFKKLPKKNWTFLVNGVDRFVPAVNAFLDEFSFVPFWRMDDVMISYAVEEGNVGAHVDNYDVFLVQAHGTREWMIEDRPVLEDDFVPNLPIRLLRRFKPTHTWLLEPGDILYLPPRFPHHGIARGGDCMTISVGFRSPSMHDILNGVVASGLVNTAESLRYVDPDLKPQAPGEISRDAISKIKAELTKVLLSDEVITDWLGHSVTESYNDVDLRATARKTTASGIEKLLRKASALVRAEGSRLAYIKTGKKVSFFDNGRRHELSGKAAELAAIIADQIVVPIARIEPLVREASCKQLIADLLSSGAVVVDTSPEGS
jgi:50S ribosomal protein L16 3-hydroxylase